MLTRFMRHPAGLVRQALRITWRRKRPAVVAAPASQKIVPPVWPERYSGIGIFLAPELTAPKKPEA